MPRIQFRSAPAENVLPSPVSTTARTAASAAGGFERGGQLGDQPVIEGVVHRKRGRGGSRSVPFSREMRIESLMPAFQVGEGAIIAGQGGSCTRRGTERGKHRCIGFGV